MGQKSGFFTSNNGDRKYTSDWLAQYIAGIISNGVYTTELTVSGGNGDMSVTVGAGRAWINGYMYNNDAALKLPLSAADGALSRTDLVVLRLDMTNRHIALAVVQGTLGGGVPSLTRTADIYELELAAIAVAAGTTAITPTIITDKRVDENVCGIVAGAVTQLSTGEMLEQLKAGFDEWFTNIKGQLSMDAAGNLQNQINAISTNGSINDSALDSTLVKLVSGALQTLGGSPIVGVQIAVGTYTGTGTYGSSNKNSLTFPFTPKFVMIMNAQHGFCGIGDCFSVRWGLSTAPRLWIDGGQYTNQVAAYSGNTITWYENSYASRQLNESGVAYAYIAFA